jgi:hypothetical protein
MMAILMKAPLLWTVLPVPWSVRGAAPALVSLAIGGLALWRFAPRHRSGSTPSGSARAPDRSRSGSETKPGPDANPPWR